MSKNPFIVEPEEKKIELPPWVDRDGRTWNLWINVRKELSVGESKRLMRAVSTVTQQIATRARIAAGEQANPEARLEWTEYSFARMMAYIVDWSLAHEPEFKLPANRNSYEKLHQDLFDVIDNALDEHEVAVNSQKKATVIEKSPSAISA